MTNAALAGIFIPFFISVVLAVYRIRKGRGFMTSFESKTVDEFLRRALHPEGGYRFSGQEWADLPADPEPPEPQPKKKGILGKIRREGSTLPDKFEPPLVRLHCTGCRNNWDAWVSDEGELEDPRDAHCACDKGGFVCVAKEGE